jgi:hypothetical protein
MKTRQEKGQIQVNDRSIPKARLPEWVKRFIHCPTLYKPTVMDTHGKMPEKGKVKLIFISCYYISNSGQVIRLRENVLYCILVA